MANNGFSVREDVLNFVRQGRGVGLAGDGSVWSRPYRLWHRLDIPKAGNALLRFFNEAKALGVTNLDQPNTLPANYVFIAYGLKFHFLPGVDRIGRRLGIAAPTAAELTASAMNYGSAGAVVTDQTAALWKWHEKIRELLGMGTVALNISDRPIFEMYGLDTFPSGRGVVTSVAASDAMTNTSTAASIQRAFTSISNGAPVFGNAHRFPKPYAIAAGQQFNVTVQYNSPVDFTEQYLGPIYSLANAVTAGVLMCEIEGEMVSPVNG
jgi:hypothetical protein